MNDTRQTTSAAEIRISRSALEANVATMRANSPAGTLFAPIVKANAYGHGLQLVSRILADRVELLSVAEPADALAIAAIAPGRVLCLGPTYGRELRELIAAGIRVAVSDSAALPALTHDAHAHLLVDTGLHRLGVTVQDAPALARAIRRTGAHLDGVFCHVAGADHGDWIGVEQEVRILHGLPIDNVVRHTGGSSLVLERPDLIGDLARPGIALFGFYPNPLASKSVVLRPVLSMVAPVLESRRLTAGDPVGYGGSRLERDSTVATIPVGVYHGIDPRWMDGRGYVTIRGRRCALLAPPMLDYTIVDVSAVPDVARGELATIIDDSAVTGDDGGLPRTGLSAEAIATRIGSTVEHLLVGLHPAVARTVTV